MARELADKATAEFGVAIDLDDVVLTQSLHQPVPRHAAGVQPDPAVEHLRIEACWQPSVRTVECYGGPLDGEVREVASLAHPITAVAALPPGFPMEDIEPEDTFADRPVTTTEVVYHLDGWHVGHRRWIYRVPR